MPLLLSVLPLWPALDVARAWLHPVFIVLLAPVAYRAAHSGTRHQARIPLLLGLGVAAVTAAWVGHDVWGPAGETAVTLVGSVLLVSGHWFNARAHRASSGKAGCTEDALPKGSTHSD